MDGRRQRKVVRRLIERIDLVEELLAGEVADASDAVGPRDLADLQAQPFALDVLLNLRSYLQKQIGHRCASP